MSIDELVAIINHVKSDSKPVSNKQKGYIENFKDLSNSDFMYLYDEEYEETYYLCSEQSFQDLQSVIGLEFGKEFVYISYEDEVIVGYRGYDDSTEFIKDIIDIQSNDDYDKDGNYVAED
ncbi:hypothetical protein D3C75_541250 [compost metagenome]